MDVGGGEAKSMFEYRMQLSQMASSSSVQWRLQLEEELENWLLSQLQLGMWMLYVQWERRAGG